MDPLEYVTDRSIRRALGFAGFGVGLVMVALSFDLVLALRSGADLVALAAVVMFFLAWRTPRRDMRHSEAWVMLGELMPQAVKGVRRAELLERLRRAMRRRLLWHAERLGMLALTLWGLAIAIFVLRAL
jgi:hypothetical protein